MNTRHRDLLTELAQGFRRGVCLLRDFDWLVEHDVTVNECRDLSQEIAEALTDTYGLEIPDA